MLNRPTHEWTSAPAAERAARRTGPAEVRLGVIWGVACLLLAGVAWRMVQVQTSREAFTTEWAQTRTTTEPLASHAGRILTSDGHVLAQDVTVYHAAVHYRWIQDPPDADWLRRQARSRLDREARRDAERVAAAEQEVVAEQARLWDELARHTGRPVEELALQRRQIQERVERIRTSVLARRRERAPAPVAAPVGEPQPEWWQKVLAVLTTPPEREAEEPLVVQEELDYHTLVEEIPLAQAAEIEAHPERFPGVRIRTGTRREYPEGELAAHLVGYRSRVSAEELQKRAGRLETADPLDYQVGDWVGRTGIERYFERELRGLRGEQRVTSDRRGELVSIEIVRGPQAGRDVILALHGGLQERAEKILDDALASVATSADDPAAPAPPAGGCLVVLDVRTGELLAGASAPRFSLSLVADRNAAAWRQLTADPRRPFFHRLTHMTLPPGSVFKAVTAVALLESGRWNPDEPHFCQGFLDHPRSHRCYTFKHFGTGHAEVDLTRALAESCNVYFFQGARQIGPGPIAEWGARFGFGQPTGVDLPGERRGTLPVPPSMNGPARTGTPWYSGDTLGLAIGQSSLTATPLQVARMMAAVANGGRLVTPHVARERLLTDGSVQPVRPAVVPPSVGDLAPETLARVREGLEQVVAHPRGTGHKTVRLEAVRIAGKTGTAEVGGRPDHAWFAGYVPADRPRYAFVVVLEHAGSGGRAAGPPSRDLVRAMLDLELLP